MIALDHFLLVRIRVLRGSSCWICVEKRSTGRSVAGEGAFLIY